MLKTIVIMLIAVMAGTIGDILLAKGMKELGDLSTMNFRGIMDTAFRAITQWKIILGTAMLTMFFILWLAVLSWEDVSVAVPLQALSYVLVALLAKYMLHEQVSPLRWAGIALICIGAFLITKSSDADQKPEPSTASSLQSTINTGG